MDIFEMAEVQFQRWTLPQVLIFTAILILVGIGLIYRTKSKKVKWTQAAALWLCILFLGIIFGATVFTRTPMESRIVKPIPFWSWVESIVAKDIFLLEQIVLNCLMLAPFGFLLPWIFDRKVKMKYAFLAGFLAAVVIELSQLISKLGWFEWDDMIHNGVSCMLGCVVGNCMFHGINEGGSRK